MLAKRQQPEPQIPKSEIGRSFWKWCHPIQYILNLCLYTCQYTFIYICVWLYKYTYIFINVDIFFYIYICEILQGLQHPSYFVAPLHFRNQCAHVLGVNVCFPSELSHGSRRWAACQAYGASRELPLSFDDLQMNGMPRFCTLGDMIWRYIFQKENS